VRERELRISVDDISKCRARHRMSCAKWRTPSNRIDSFEDEETVLLRFRFSSGYKVRYGVETVKNDKRRMI
jgi:hypothetical protein